MVDVVTYPCKVPGASLHEPTTLHNISALQPALQEGVSLHLDVLCQNVLQPWQLCNCHGAPSLPGLAVGPDASDHAPVCPERSSAVQIA